MTLTTWSLGGPCDTDHASSWSPRLIFKTSPTSPTAPPPNPGEQRRRAAGDAAFSSVSPPMVLQSSRFQPLTKFQ